MNSRYTREIHTPDPAPKLAAKERRYSLRRQGQTILHVKELPHDKQHRAVWCGRHIVTEGLMPVIRSHDGCGARVGNIKTCGSVWACPVCAAKVAEVRRRELTYAMVQHQAQGGYAFLLTFTFPHYKNQTLAELLPLFEKAFQGFQNAKGWKKVMDVKTDKKPAGTAGRVGSVNSKEVTIGKANGWHPHVHMLVFCQPDAFGPATTDDNGRLSSAAIDYFKAQWVAKLEKAGLVDGDNRQWAMQYGLDVRGGQQAAEYIAKWGHEEKWGLSSELTSSHAKLGKRNTWGTKDHYTPFQLLEMSAAGDGHATCAYREFVKAFDGKRMLTWTRGLKDHFGIADMDDDTAAAEQELELDTEHHVGFINQQQLTVLVTWGTYGQFLTFIAEHGHREDAQQLINDWIDNTGSDRRRSGNVLQNRMVIGGNRYWYEAEEVQA